MPASPVAPLLIGQFAAQFGLNPKTIRYYESLGLLPTPSRSQSGYRLYDQDDSERLAFIIKARSFGLLLAEIAQILALHAGGQPPCPHVLLLVAQKITAVDAQLRILAEFRQELLLIHTAAHQGAVAEGAICGIIEHYQGGIAANEV